jgi:hypothetical protein
LFRLSRSLEHVPSLSDAGAVNVPAIVAMLPAIVIGTVGAGTINWFGHHYWFLPGPLSWVSAGAVYLVGMALVARSPHALRLAGFSRQAAASLTARSGRIEDLATLANAG